MVRVGGGGHSAHLVVLAVYFSFLEPVKRSSACHQRVRVGYRLWYDNSNGRIEIIGYGRTMVIGCGRIVLVLASSL